MRPPGIRRAFTLIELMIVVAILALLAGLAIARFGSLLDKSKEGATRGELSSLRSALYIYYSDNTFYPTDDLSSLTENKHYIDNIPLAMLPGTDLPENRHVTVGNSTFTAITGTGGWAYVNDPSSPDWGTLLVNCTLPDANGKNWDEQ